MAKEPAEKKKEEVHYKSWLHKLWHKWIFPLAIVVLVTTAFRSSIVDWNDVPSGSMNPTILEGDRVFVNKLAYDLKVPFTDWRLARWSSPQRGDIVVFFSPEPDRTRLIKRVIGLPGDTIQLRDNYLIINGQPIEQITESETSRRILKTEKLGNHTHPVQLVPAGGARPWFPNDREEGRQFIRTYEDKSFTVPPGHYFMMGDNRNNSRDSRWFGTVPEANIAGKSTAIVLSLDPADTYTPRWSRFFKGLP